MTDYNFEITSPLKIEESSPKKLLLKGVFVRLEMPTRNGRIYRIDEGERIASYMKGLPLYYGATSQGRHQKLKPVGAVVKAYHNDTANVVEGIVMVTDEALIPHIKKGWGFSIGGKFAAFETTGNLNTRGNQVIRIYGMMPNHLQLLSPKTPRGDVGAYVADALEIQESLRISIAPYEHALMIKERIEDRIHKFLIPEQPHTEDD